MDNKLQVLNDLESSLNSDTTLNGELKQNLLKLVADVKSSPSDDNLEALAVAMDSVADSEEYKGILSAMSAWTAKQMGV